MPEVIPNLSPLPPHSDNAVRLIGGQLLSLDTETQPSTSVAVAHENALPSPGVADPEVSDTRPVSSPGFKYNDDLLDTSYDEQVRMHNRWYEYQNAPIPSFEGVPVVGITPPFSPTNAPVEEIYARNRVPMSMRSYGHAPHSEFDHTEPVDIWRIVDRMRLKDGSALVSSQILHHGTVGDIENFDGMKHYGTHHESRDFSGKETPFVSFVTDPEGLAEDYILRAGFGVKGGRDSVVVRVKVDPSRVITHGQKKDTGGVLLIGGVAPDEYVAAYEIADFVSTLVPENRAINHVVGTDATMSRSEAFEYWTS